jgi:hypothetical protein
MFNLNRVSVFQLPVRVLSAAAVLTALLWSVSSAHAADPALIVVNGEGDNIAVDGRCTLREAIIASNTNTSSGENILGECLAGTSEIDTILFSPFGPGDSVMTITPASPLPAVTRPVIMMRATTGVQIRGRLTFEQGSAGSEVSTLTIQQVHLLGGRVTLNDNQIGSNLAGTASDNSVGDGILIDSSNNVIGFIFQGVQHGNLISGSTSGAGVHVVSGSGNKIQGNLIGTDVSGTTALPNLIGIHVQNDVENTTIGGNGAVQGNIISGNTESGIRLDAGAKGTKLGRNRIGLDRPTGFDAIPNGIGIQDFGSKSTVIGGKMTEDTNFISGNAIGIRLAGGSPNVKITGNLIGLGVASLNVPNETGILVETAPAKLDISANSFDFQTAAAINLTTFGGNKISGHDNCFGLSREGNEIGIAYTGTNNVDFSKNFWGAANGPSGVGPGSGDPIDSSLVDFGAFLTTPSASCNAWRPTLTAPANNTLISATAPVNILFKWNAVPSASQYELKFNGISTMVTSGLSQQINGVPFGRFQWTVKTHTFDVGAWVSSSREVYVSIAKSPKPAAKISRNTTFSWMAFPGATSYTLSFFLNGTCSGNPAFAAIQTGTSFAPGAVSTVPFAGQMSWLIKPNNGPAMPCMPFTA